nr:hypothetical protein [Tanacetum cinerariifolium]
MSSTFADTHNMVAILNKSDASEDFDQILDFLNGSYIRYALTVNPHIYVSCRKFNFSKYIFDSLVRNVDNSSKFYMYPRVGKGFSRVETPLFEGILVVQENVVEGIVDEQVPDDTAIATAQEVVTTAVLEDTVLDAGAALTLRVEHLERDKEAQTLEITKLKTQVKKLERVNKVKGFKLRRLKKVGTSQRVETSDDTIMEDVSNQGRMIVELDRDKGVELMNEQEKTKKVIDIVDDAQVEGRQAKKQAEIYQIDLDHPSKVLSMQDDDSKVQEAVEVVTTAKLITKVVNAASTPVSTASTIIPTAKPNIPAVTLTAAPVKDKGKGIMIEEPKLIKKKQQVELDEAYVRKLHEELNQDIDWDVAMDHVKQKAKEDPFIQRYQEQIKEEDERAIASINKTPAQKAAKRRKLNEEAKEVEDLKQHLEIVPDEDDDVYTEATSLARKTMFGRPDGQDNVWKSQRSVHGQALVKSWKLLTSCKVHIISFTTTQLILLVERRYPLLKFTLEQMLNVVRLQVEEQSEMSLELLRFTRQQLQEGQQE